MLDTKLIYDEIEEVMVLGVNISIRVGVPNLKGGSRVIKFYY